MKKIHFINLTNGIEAIEKYNLKNPLFIRIQSTACEQKRWSFILDDLDYTFLMYLALGYECILYDYSARKKQPRAFYQGVEWIKYVLNLRWFGKENIPYVRDYNTVEYFREEYRKLNRRTKRKIDYFKKFLNCDELNIKLICDSTINDSNYHIYKEKLNDYILVHRMSTFFP